MQGKGNLIQAGGKALQWNEREKNPKEHTIIQLNIYVTKSRVK